MAVQRWLSQRANVKKLVLSHISDFGPRLDPGQWHTRAQQGYHGDVVIGSDLQARTLR